MAFVRSVLLLLQGRSITIFVFAVIICALNLSISDAVDDNGTSGGGGAINCSLHGEAGPLGIDYVFALECRGGGLSVEDGVPRALAYCLLRAEASLLLYFLGDTADGYFSPVLGVICDRLGIGEDLAGVTLLAFGNGAPDVFSSIAAFSHGDSSPDLGLGALLGAGVFVQTVVLGAVCTVSDVSVAPSAFIRDLAFFALTVSVLLIWGWRALDITLAHAATFVGIYAVYVGVVLWFEARAKRAARLRRGNATAEDEERQEANRAGRVMHAYWHDEGKGEPETSGSAGGEYTFMLHAHDEKALADRVQEQEEEDEFAAFAASEELGIELQSSVLTPKKLEVSEQAQSAAFGGAILVDDYCSASD